MNTIFSFKHLLCALQLQFLQVIIDKLVNESIYLFQQYLDRGPRHRLLVLLLCRAVLSDSADIHV